MKEKIIEILTKELNYSDYAADLTADDLLSISEQLQPLLQKWLETREKTNVTIAGFSTKELVTERNYTYPSTLIAMDWLLTEPEIATKELSKKIRR